MSNQLTTKDLFHKQSIQERFEKLLGKKAQGFITSVLQTVNANRLLNNADPQTVLNAAATAASLDLPINQNLGFAWIVPYKGQAQFQMGWKGFVQLALRTGQYSRINVTEVFENQFKGFNRLTEELDADFDIEGEGEVVGYAAYFRLNNGMEKTVYWTKEAVKKHASKYSQTYGKKSSRGGLIHSPWNDETQFDAMAKKTVLKNMISKWGIMSIEMQTAQLADQAIVQDDNNYQYVDNVIDIEANAEETERKRIEAFIEKATTPDELLKVKNSLSDDLQNEYSLLIENKENELILEHDGKKN